MNIIPRLFVSYMRQTQRAAGIYRAFYLLKSERGVLVFHAFEKRTPKTPPREIELGRRKLREMLHE